jgi:hypothetical protein
MHCLITYAYQYDATAKQAIEGKNKQIFALKENDIYIYNYNGGDGRNNKICIFNTKAIILFDI